MPTPVIYLAFSNDRDDYLPNLRRERKHIERSLRPADQAGLIKLVMDDGASLEDIFETVRAYDQQIALFHFAGHAGGRQLQLETPELTGSGAHAAGLAELLGRQQSLQLVFLNGCSTLDQVNLLLDAGVPAVIATSAAVDDDRATEFAEQFYRSLAGHLSIERAFDVARSFLRAKHTDAPEVERHRGIKTTETTAPAWGLYTSENAAEVLNWALPQRTEKKQVLRNRFDYESRPDVNDILIDAVCEDLARYNPDLDYELNKVELDIPSIKREIADSFPLPIGEQLRKLMTRSNDPAHPDEMELFSTQRLAQLALTYRTTVQFICFTFLSQLWDEKYENANLKLDESQLFDLNGFFSLTRDNFHRFDYFQLTRTILHFFEAQRIPCFMDEFGQLPLDEGQNPELFEAHRYLHSIYLDLAERGAPRDDLEEQCMEAEHQLGLFLKTFAFLVQYKLATIKNIEIIKNRHEAAKYRHSQITLNKALTVATTGVTEVGVIFSNFTDSKCVLFLKTVDDEVQDYLSLSPFLLDKNALTNDFSSQLYLYSFREKDQYVFQFLNDPRNEFRLAPETYPDIAGQFNRFRAEVFGYVFEPRAKPGKPDGRSRFFRKRKPS